MFPTALRRHRDLLIFSIYAATVGAGWRLYLGLFASARGNALTSETIEVFFLALSAAAIAGLIARDAVRPVDGFFAFLMAWLLFGFLAACYAFLWAIMLALEGHNVKTAIDGVGQALLIGFLALWFGSVVVIVSCVVFQSAKFIGTKCLQ